MKVNVENTGALVLAAGKGTRMHSDRPKVLHTLLGETMVSLVLDALMLLTPGRIWTVVGHEAEQVREAIGDGRTDFIQQKEQLGTGHAFQIALPRLAEAKLEYLLVVNADVPLISSQIVTRFIQDSMDNMTDLSFMSMTVPVPGLYGRVQRQNGKVKAILEAKDYDPARDGPDTHEVNTGIYLFRLDKVAPLASRLSLSTKSGEYYITDLIGLGIKTGLNVMAFNQGEGTDLLGVNSPKELLVSEEILRRRILDSWIAKGVIIRSPQSTRIGPWVVLQPGCEIGGPCEIYGKSVVERGALIESNTWLSDVEIGAGARVRPFSHVENASLGPRTSVGPFARIRPGTRILEDASVGNFVEMKNTTFGKGSKAGHLSYLGDAEVESGVNIGAGTITCNYDGKNKHKTKIGEKAFIGSNTSLVAPVSVGGGALVGAGSVITQDVPENNLGIARGRQINIPRKTDK